MRHATMTIDAWTPRAHPLASCRRRSPSAQPCASACTGVSAPGVKPRPGSHDEDGRKCMDRRLRVIRSIALGCALGTLALPTFAATTPAPGQAVDAVLSAHVAPGVRSDVMVFGTAHLRAFEGKLEPRHMEETLALLGRYAPTRIAVERLAPDEIALLRERAPHDAGARTVLEQFAQRIVGHGQAAQELLGID